MSVLGIADTLLSPMRHLLPPKFLRSCGCVPLPDFKKGMPSHHVGAQVHKLAREVRTYLDGAPLGVLDNNAGVYELKRSTTKDGFEMTWGVSSRENRCTIETDTPMRTRMHTHTNTEL